MWLPLSRATLAVLCLWGLGANAGAHSIPFPLRLDLTVESNRMVLAVEWDEDSHDEGPRLRARFDADGDGTLNQDEGDHLAAWLAREAVRRVTVTVDGANPAWVTTSVSGLGTSGQVASDAPLGVFAILAAPLPAEERITVTLKAEGEHGQRYVPLRVRRSGWPGAPDGTEETRIRAGEGWTQVFARGGR